MISAGTWFTNSKALYIIVALGVLLVLWLRGGALVLAVPVPDILRQFLDDQQVKRFLLPFNSPAGASTDPASAVTLKNQSMNHFLDALLAMDCERAVNLMEARSVLDRPSNHFLTGSCWQQVDQTDLAYAWWTRPAGSLEHYFVTLGQQCASQQDDACQARYYEAAVAILRQPDWKATRVLLDYFRRTRQIEFIDRIANDLQTYDNSPGLVAYAQATYLAEQGEYDKALASYEQALAEEASIWHVYRDAGRVALTLDQFEHARAYWQQALTLRPGYEQLYLLTAAAYLEEGRLDDAFATYVQAGDTADSLRGRAEIRRQQGRLEEARALIEAALVIEPNDEKIQALLARICEAQGDDDCR